MIDRLRLQAVDFQHPVFIPPAACLADLVATRHPSRRSSERPRSVLSITGSPACRLSAIFSGAVAARTTATHPASFRHFFPKKYLPAIVCARPRGVQFIHHMPISGGRA
ncbi:hypothetical protein G3N96_12650 [Burkholderia sp. Se-20373]|uniref:hypothetical protein n=1 Tax=Burkholderia sp. Se-20373 TaxID=2703898 RepID=UPI00197CF84C|nr:hypothetical protein [Burkholderia sp. Se-20373]MBN3746275.1 hypothetical protein [Burkholderia sp. Se-20373]